MKAVYLYVRNLETNEIVDSIEIKNLSEDHVEKVMRGLLRNMNTDRYFVDDSEVDEVREK